MRVHDDWTSGKRLTNLAIFSLFVAATLFIAAGWLGWTPARMLAGRDGTWVPNLLAGGLVAIAVTFLFILRLRGALNDAASRLEIASSLSGHDELTGLIGRTTFFAAIDARTDEPTGARPFCLMLIDLDRFKEINDGFGHQAGDQVLAAAARRLRAFWGQAALVARLGGDEFAVVIDGDIADPAVATACEQMIAEMRKPIAIETWTVSLTCSMGVVLAPRDGSTREELISRADRALYAAKARGRAQAVIFDIEMEKDVTRRRFT
ncbi:MAG: GGDEF domain-containing protein, partial [Alphaproteobacteria bacterium]